MSFRKFERQIDTRIENVVICPYCGFVQQDVWEYRFENEETEKIDCQNCENEFEVYMRLNPLYTTNKIIEDRPEYDDPVF